MLQKFLMGDEGILDLLLFIPVVLFTLTMHELIHGYVAYKLGDDTAYNAGRLSFNPLTHLDLIGTLMILFVGFGWAKPVPINPNRFYKKYNMRLGILLVSIAGPLSNLIIAFISLILYRYVHYIPIDFIKPTVRIVLILLVNLNISLAAFNLLPIPPLDGSEILKMFLSDRAYFTVTKYEQFGFLLLLLLINLPVFSTMLMSFISLLYKVMQWIINFLPV